MIVPYPTYAEVGKRAAITYFHPRFDEARNASHHGMVASLALIA
jgi:hypothetical protein